MNNLFKHANTNPSLWINVCCLLSALIITAMHDEWVKSNSLIILGLGIANFSVTSVLQYLRDMKHTPDGLKVISVDSSNKDN